MWNCLVGKSDLPLQNHGELNQLVKIMHPEMLPEGLTKHPAGIYAVYQFGSRLQRL
jgi:hypothetical protein